MSETNKWTDNFSSDNFLTVEIKDMDKSVQLEVLEVGENDVFLDAPDDTEILDILKFENRVRIRGLRDDRTAAGYIQLVEVGPSDYERETNLNQSDSKKLIRFVAESISGSETGNCTIESDRPSNIFSWFKTLRVYSLTASLIPMLLGVSYAFWMGWQVNLIYTSLAVTAGLLLHLASNLHNDVSDHLKEVDYLGSHGGSGVIQKGWLSARTVWKVAIAFYLLGILSGLPVLYARGSELFVVGTLGFLGASGYSFQQYGYKYTGLGDLCVFVMLGPLMTIGTCIAAAGVWNVELILASLPVGCFVALILHGNNINDIPIDRRAGATTLAILLGFEGSKRYYQFLMLTGYFLILVFVLVGIIPEWSLFTFLTIPLAFKNVRIMNDAKNPMSPSLAKLRFVTARLHLMVGLGYVFGFLAESWWS